MDWVQIVSSLGFPICAFGLCAWFLRYVYDRSLAMFQGSLDKIGTLAEAVNHNTEVLSDLAKTIGERIADDGK